MKLISTAKKVAAFALFAASVNYGAFAQVPTNNPFLDMYPEYNGTGHWTTSIKWNSVYNINDYANNIQQITVDGVPRQDWLAAYNAARDAAYANGGGVIYFPPLPAPNPFEDSSYYFSDDLLMRTGVVLRGATPSVNNAKDSLFAPPTLFEFPKYNYTPGVDGGVPNSSAFKEITLFSPNEENVGLVNIDINRARISAHPSFSQIQVQGQTVNRESSTVKNIIIMGIRNNNVAIPDLNVPKGLMASWLRYPWRFGSNVDLYVQSNAVVCNNRFNDYLRNVRPITSDNFNMSGYTGEAGGASQVVEFDYNQHYVILINRLKKVGYNATLDFYNDGNTTAEFEPALYATGIVIRDNWMYKTARSAIHASGTGLVVKGNIIRDKINKVALVKPEGTSLADAGDASARSYENIGIECTGTDVLIENNDIQVYRHKWGAGTLTNTSLHTDDGEGIVAKNFPFNGYTIRNNVIRTNTICYPGQGTTTKGYNGLVTGVNQVQNVLVEDNDFGNMPLRIDGESGIASNIIVRRNINIGTRYGQNIGIKVSGNAGGAPSFVYKNTGVPGCDNVTPIIDRSCNVCLDSLGIIGQGSCDNNTNTALTTTTCTPIPTVLCDGASPQIIAAFPAVTMTSPATDVTIPFAQTSYDISVAIAVNDDGEGCPYDTVLFYANNELIGKVATGGASTATFTFNNIPEGVNYVYASVKRLVFNTGAGATSTIIGSSNIVKITRETTVSLSKFLLSTKDVALYPNPAVDEVRVEISNNEVATYTINLTDMMGKLLQTKAVAKNENVAETTLNVSNLPRGMYLLQINNGTQRVTKKLIKQ